MILKVVELLNTILFRHLHINQQKADTPMRIRYFAFLSTPLINQLPNIFVILAEGGRSKAKKKHLRQSNFEKGQAVKRCSVDSCASQKQHFVHPFQFLIANNFESSSATM
jgi:hypothetical protein